MTQKKQLELWLKGDSIHNKDKNECCPDFSCCNKKMKTDYKIRKLFYDAYHRKDYKVVDVLLMGFLSDAISTMNLKKKIYMAGQVDIPHA